MATPKFGFPLILGAKLRHLNSALEWAIRDEQPPKFFSPSQSSNPAISGQNLAVRLQKVDLQAGSNGEVALQADFKVLSGSLSIAGQSVSAYSIRSQVTVSTRKSLLLLDPAGAGTRLLANGGEHAISKALAGQFGLQGTASLDLAPFRLGRWQLVPTGPTIRAEGDHVFVGMDVLPQHPSVPFRYKAGEKPQVDASAFTNLPTGMVSKGWGYLMDASLAVILIREIEIEMNARKDMRGFVASIREFNGNGITKANGGGEFNVTGAGIFNGWKGFTFDADIEIKIVKGRIEVHWKVTEAKWGVISVMDRMPSNAKSGVLRAGLPLELGSTAADFGKLEVDAVSGGRGYLYGTGPALTLPVEAPEVFASNWTRDVFVEKGGSSVLMVDNAAPSKGKRRAPLFVYSMKIHPMDPDFIAHSKAPAKVLAGKRTPAAIQYQGTGTQKAALRIINNDEVVDKPLVGWETEGKVSMPAQLEFKYVYHPYLHRSITKKVKVTNTGKGPLFLNLELLPQQSYFSKYPYDPKMTLNPGESKTIDLSFNPGTSPAGTVAQGELVATTQSGKKVRTQLTGRVVESRWGVGVIWTKKLDIAVHLWEIRQFLNWVTAKDILEKEFEDYTPPPRPRPCPDTVQMDWAKYRLVNAPSAEGLSLEKEACTLYNGEGAVAMAAIPEGVDAWPQVHGNAEGKVQFQVERWMESREYEMPLEGHVQAMTWLGDQLIVGTDMGTQVVALSDTGRPMQVASWETQGATTALAGADAWVLRGTEEGLEMGLSPEASGYMPLESRMSAPVQVLQAMGDGYFLAVSAEAIEVLRPGTDGLNPLQSLGLPFAVRKIEVHAQGFLAIGDGLASFAWDDGQASLLNQVATPPVETVLRMGDAMVARTRDNELLVVDVTADGAAVSGRIQELAGMEASALFTEVQAAQPASGLLASAAGNVLQIRQLRARGVDEAWLQHQNTTLAEIV